MEAPLLSSSKRNGSRVSEAQSLREFAKFVRAFGFGGLRPGTPLSLEDAKRLIQQYVDRYNNVRLHSATGYVTPNDMLAGPQAKIHAERDRKLEAARLLRKSRRQQAA
jgi:putative transposase